ncbi:beta-ketoacyl-[acyl-carrier-protein] synthase family protein [Bacillus aquiflavi]|uniref:Beta-ketoacyl-[acyl-carrier-protein] synthase family protein n=1 Tax=Bacillus aquiflavi TaxID=2672567 RepID=A0A6B3VY38_9BACI|nr:beta-ketoacyl-[acyl-carrier-protein] synthase family protein [Bacillus aquiflavi]MBA4536818.1 beta-ketoacyl-[acyl-carrier-protein] synthase family protein [Bacillus aquiflavi]NEY81185.1 beta-ketoacyl-[acyl-carrier-protein] synthase family protein [Bacillus aquiflavi]UAC49746.1 beta-ketoacyl-[acyl-carrier-protein] synthase family protein [Bacillus aquiflavi]
MKQRVVITGFSTITSLGKTIDTWDGICSNKSGYSPLPERITKYGDFRTKHAAIVQEDNLNLKAINDKKIDRTVQLAYSCAEEALTMSKINNNEVEPTKFGVIMGTGAGAVVLTGQQLINLHQYNNRKITPNYIPAATINSLSGYLAIKYHAQGPNMTVSTACASGNHAIGLAFDTIASGKADIMMAGGADSPTDGLIYSGFDNMRVMAPNNEPCQPFSSERKGFIIGEGAAVLILESLDHALQRGATIYGEVKGYSMTCDAYHMLMPVVDGSQIERTIENALEDAGVTVEEIDYINAHGTGTQAGDLAEINGIKRLFRGQEQIPPISSIKGAIGHTLGASGAIEAVICLLAMEKNTIPPSVNLQAKDPKVDVDIVGSSRKKDLKVIVSNSFGFGGNNCTLIFKKLAGEV